MRRRTRLAAVAGAVLLMSALAVVPRMAFAEGIRIKIYNIIGDQFGMCLLRDYQYGTNSISAEFPAACPGGDYATWMVDGRRLTDTTRSRCLTHEDGGWVRLTNCHPQYGDSRESWNFTIGGDETVIASVYTGGFLKEDYFPTVSLNGIPSDEIPRWHIYEVGEIEFPDNPTG